MVESKIRIIVPKVNDKTDIPKIALELRKKDDSLTSIASNLIMLEDAKRQGQSIAKINIKQDKVRKIPRLLFF